MHHVQPTHSPIHVRANIFLLRLMTIGQALLLLGVLMRSAGVGPHAVPPEAELEPSVERAETARESGRREAMVRLPFYSAIGVVWAPLCAVALRRRRGWARAATMGYWGFAVVAFVLPLPLAAYGLFALSRPSTRAYFASPSVKGT